MLEGRAEVVEELGVADLVAEALGLLEGVDAGVGGDVPHLVRTELQMTKGQTIQCY